MPCPSNRSQRQRARRRRGRGRPTQGHCISPQNTRFVSQTTGDPPSDRAETPTLLRPVKSDAPNNVFYIKLPKETIHYTDRFLSLRQTENCPIDRQDSFPDTDRKLSGNKKEIKKNHLTIRESKEPRSPYGKFQNVFLSEKELEDIRQTIPDWQDYIERLSGYMAST